MTHPSQPNYLALFSGSTQGVTDDSCPLTFSGANLAAQLQAAGRTFVGYSEDLPARRVHRLPQPAATPASTTRGSTSPTCPRARTSPTRALPADFADLPTVSFVVPNLCNDMHDCGVAAGDRWAQRPPGRLRDLGPAAQQPAGRHLRRGQRLDGQPHRDRPGGPDGRARDQRPADRPLQRAAHARGHVRAGSAGGGRRRHAPGRGLALTRRFRMQSRPHGPSLGRARRGPAGPGTAPALGAGTDAGRSVAAVPLDRARRDDRADDPRRWQELHQRAAWPSSWRAPWACRRTGCGARPGCPRSPIPRRTSRPGPTCGWSGTRTGPSRRPGRRSGPRPAGRRPLRCGAPSGTRTPNPLIKSQLLCQLS